MDTVSLDQGLLRTTAPNGLVVLTETLPGVRSAAVGIYVRTASAHERREQMGISHLLEHMVFKGTERRTARELALDLEVRGGSLDAYTGRDATSYQAHVLDADLPLAVEILTDLVRRPLLRESDLEPERNVILEEINGVADTPDDLVFELHGEQLWGAHPYGYRILGTRESVSSLTTADLKSLHDRAYHPGNVIVAASGNIEHEELVRILENAGWSQAVSRDARPAAPPPAVAIPTSVRHVEREGAQTHIVFGSPTVAHGDVRRHALGLVGMLLGGGMSSRLFQRIREDLGLAYSVYTFQSFHRDSGNHGIYVGTAPETAAQAAEAIREELATISKNGLTEEELAAGKSQLKGQITLSLESVSSRMYRAAGVELYDEEYKTLDELLALVDGISQETVAEVSRDFFSPNEQTVVSLGPRAAW